MTDAIAHPECAELEPLLAAYIDGETHRRGCRPLERSPRRLSGVPDAGRFREGRRGTCCTRGATELVACASPQLRQAVRRLRVRRRAATCSLPSLGVSCGARWVPLSFAATCCSPSRLCSSRAERQRRGAGDRGWRWITSSASSSRPTTPRSSRASPARRGSAVMAGRSPCRAASRSSSSSSSTSGAACRRRARRRTSCTGGAGTPLSVYVLNSAPKSDVSAERLVSPARARRP